MRPQIAQTRGEAVYVTHGHAKHVRARPTGNISKEKLRAKRAPHDKRLWVSDAERHEADTILSTQVDFLQALNVSCGVVGFQIDHL